MSLFMHVRPHPVLSHHGMGDASSAKHKAERAETAVKELEARTDRLALACQALLEILQEKAGISEDEVREKMKEIDLRDGQEDGKIGRRAMACENCGRTIGSQRENCMYCGHRNRAAHLVQ